ncbi:substrate-binding periplasmic protein [Aestuariirhabdus litorea]|uniref:Solute-binding protein family 3/N-terminal domain-containing protein n=1 Tax=Aestuariirhabdus litorea TaxID=2528527 RepID=A0A3P3VR86_9GAMM|nr:transporter substrate-binding domain-containing protein [Aestuariirhabdus litorea]RRJ84817.1 hypothetical protein D0544_06920 [Aestuariirhabdus litorea]RWW98042.1 transporter substrate-binding domain-containing protein [Endozoicomonadaceae bacterium GTF-13]
MPSYRPLLLSLFLLLGPLVSGGLHADSIAVATTTVKPWGYLDNEGAPQGLLSQFIRELEDHSGLPMNNTLEPYPRVIQEIKSGKADIAVLLKSPESDKFAIDLGEVVKTSTIFIALAGTPPIDTLDALIGSRVGHIRGSKYGTEFDDHPSIHRVPVSDVAQGLRMLRQGRIEALASTDYSLFYTLRELHIDPGLLTQLISLKSNSGHLYLSRRSPKQELREPLQQALEQMRSNGVLQRLFAKPYLSDSLSPAEEDTSSLTNTDNPKVSVAR